jgi:enoyl-CoA hydratase/carnithine racemase
MSHILVEDIQGVRVITLNRPDKLNAITIDMYNDMTKAVAEGCADDAVKVFLFKGQSNCFTAGNDISGFVNSGEVNAEHPTFKFLFTMLDATKPVVAAVAGAAVGIGTTLLLHCDLAYAAPNTKFKLPFVDLALVPEAGSSFMLPRLIGQVNASELLLLGGTFDAEKAYAYNLINGIVDENEVADFAMKQAIKLSKKPPQAVAMTREMLRGDKEDIRAAMHKEIEGFASRLQSDEAKAIFKAFLSR